MDWQKRGKIHITESFPDSEAALAAQSPDCGRLNSTGLVPGAGLEPACRNDPARDFKFRISQQSTINNSDTQLILQ
jgi:hypothetical protein